MEPHYIEAKISWTLRKRSSVYIYIINVVLGIDHVKIVASVEDIIYDPKGIIIEILSYPDKRLSYFDAYVLYILSSSIAILCLNSNCTMTRNFQIYDPHHVPYNKLKYEHLQTTPEVFK